MSALIPLILTVAIVGFLIGISYIIARLTFPNGELWLTYGTRYRPN